MRRVTSGLAIIAAGITLQACALLDQVNTARAYNYVSVSHASHHIDAQRDFEEWNPGLGVGSEAPLADTRTSVGVEAGRYRNSLGDNSTYSVGYWEYDLIPEAMRRVRVGGFAGLAEYPYEADNSRLPSFGDFVVVGGVQATVATFGNHEFRFRAAPGLSQSQAIITLQSNFKF